MRDPKEKVLSLLNYRDRTENEIRESLAKSGYNETQIEDTVEEFKTLRYIDDIKYAENFIDSSKEKKRGPYRMRRELASKGVSANIIDDAIYKMVDYEWEFSAAQQISEGIKFKNPNLSDEKLLAKIINKLNYEGFSNDIINEIAQEVFHDSDY